MQVDTGGKTKNEKHETKYSLSHSLPLLCSGVDSRTAERAMSQQSRLGQLSGIASSSRISLDSNHHHQQQSFNDRRDSSIPRELNDGTTTGKYGEQSPLSISPLLLLIMFDALY